MNVIMKKAIPLPIDKVSYAHTIQVVYEEVVVFCGQSSAWIDQARRIIREDSNQIDIGDTWCAHVPDLINGNDPVLLAETRDHAINRRIVGFFRAVFWKIDELHRSWSWLGRRPG